MKLKPDLLDRYKIHVLAMRAKRMKDAADGSMDLQSYVEFKRNYRMLARVHKEALQCQRDFWKLFMHHKAQDSTVKQAMRDLEASSARAQVRAAVGRLWEHAALCCPRPSAAAAMRQPVQIHACMAILGVCKVHVRGLLAACVAPLSSALAAPCLALPARDQVACRSNLQAQLAMCTSLLGSWMRPHSC